MLSWLNSSAQTMSPRTWIPFFLLSLVLIYLLSPQCGSSSFSLSISCRSTGKLFLFVLFCFLPFLGPLPCHMKVPRLGVESELVATGTAVATRRQSHSNMGSKLSLQPTPQLSSQQRQILNPLSKARD